MTKFFLFKIKEGKGEQWEAWCVELQRRSGEASQTLQQENSSKEMCIRYGEYVLGVSEYFGDPKPTDMTNPLNIEHRRQREECLERLEGKTLYEIH